MAGKTVRINAREMAEDLRAGLDDFALMSKYGISDVQLQGFLRQLVRRRYIEQSDLNTRAEELARKKAKAETEPEGSFSCSVCSIRTGMHLVDGVWYCDVCLPSPVKGVQSDSQGSDQETQVGSTAETMKEPRNPNEVEPTQANGEIPVCRKRYQPREHRKSEESAIVRDIRSGMTYLTFKVSYGLTDNAATALFRELIASGKIDPSDLTWWEAREALGLSRKTETKSDVRNKQQTEKTDRGPTQQRRTSSTSGWAVLVPIVLLALYYFYPADPSTGVRSKRGNSSQPAPTANLVISKQEFFLERPESNFFRLSVKGIVKNVGRKAVKDILISAGCPECSSYETIVKKATEGALSRAFPKAKSEDLAGIIPLAPDLWDWEFKKDLAAWLQVRWIDGSLKKKEKGVVINYLAPGAEVPFEFVVAEKVDLGFPTLPRHEKVEIKSFKQAD